MYSIIRINYNQSVSKFDKDKDYYRLSLVLCNIKNNKIIKLSCNNSFVPEEDDIVEDNFIYTNDTDKYDTKKLIIKLPNTIETQIERIKKILDNDNNKINLFNNFNFKYGDSFWLDIYNEYIKYDSIDDIQDESIVILENIFNNIKKYIDSFIDFFIKNLKEQGLYLKYNQYKQLFCHSKFGTQINNWNKEYIKELINIESFGPIYILEIAKFLKCSKTEQYELIIIYSLKTSENSYIEFEYEKWKNNYKNKEFKIDLITKKEYKDIINKLILNDIIYNINNNLYLKDIFNKEKEIINILFKINNNNIKLKYNIEDIKKIVYYNIKLYKNNTYAPQFNFNEEQSNAITSILNNNFIIIDGKAGTGKSSVIPGIIYISNKYISNSKIFILTPTAKARMRVEDIVKENIICTYHDIDFSIDESEFDGYKKYNKNNVLLKKSDKNDKYIKNYKKNKYIEYKTIKLFNCLFNTNNEKLQMEFSNINIIIIDEISMVNLEDLYTLLINLNSINHKIKIIFSGDIRQLPSIGKGDIYNRIHICKDLFCYNELTEVTRSNNNLNNMIEFILDIKIPEINNNFKWTRINNSEQNIDICSMLPDKYNKNLRPDGYNIETDIIITQKNKDINIYTPQLRNKFNPLDEIKIRKETKTKKYLSEITLKSDKYLRLHDPVICTKNFNKEKLFNGMIGEITEISENFEINKNTKKKILDNTIITVTFKNGAVYNYNINDSIISYLEPAYMITVHKSQGQEYDNVYIYFNSNSERMTTHYSLYTAITRGKKNVNLICSKNLLVYGLNNKPVKNSMMDCMIYFYKIINNYDNNKYIELFKKYYENLYNKNELTYKKIIYDFDYKTLEIKYKDTDIIFGKYDILTDKIIKN